MKSINSREKVKQIVAQKAGIDVKEVHDDMFFEDDLNLGELELTEILEELEEVFKIDLMGDQESLESVKELLELVEEKVE